MSSTAIVGDHVEVIQTTPGGITALSWSVAIAGALAAIAVTFIFLSLGSGIGLAVASPFSGPSVGALTIAGAIWLVFAQTLGYATGGFIAGRLRIRTHIPGHETHFRDGAHGFMAWVLGVGMTLALVFMVGAYSATTAANMAGTIGSGALQGASVMASGQNNSALSPDTMSYFVDALFRTNPATQQAPARATPPATAPQPAPAAQTPAQPPQGADQSAHSPAGETPPSMALYGSVPGAGGQASDLPRAEVSRILFSGMREGGLSEGDRTYLARIVAARTGIPPEEADRRVNDIQTRALQTMRETAETARKAGAYISFWSFMALLFGAVASILGGVVGGELRDQI